jgi:hypothetical protein
MNCYRLLEDIDPNRAKELYKESAAMYEVDDKEQFASETYKIALNFLVKMKLYFCIYIHTHTNTNTNTNTLSHSSSLFLFLFLSLSFSLPLFLSHLSLSCFGIHFNFFSINMIYSRCLQLGGRFRIDENHIQSIQKVELYTRQFSFVSQYDHFTSQSQWSCRCWSCLSRSFVVCYLLFTIFSTLTTKHHKFFSSLSFLFSSFSLIWCQFIRWWVLIDECRFEGFATSEEGTIANEFLQAFESIFFSSLERS